MRGLFLSILAVAVSAGSAQAAVPAQATGANQIPICMVGDSITWAEEADYWRRYLVEQIPALAFVGHHSAALGYSHSGEGYDTTARVLERIDAIPAAPYYHLLIGTNDASAGGGSRASLVRTRADRMVAVVRGLLDKPGAKKVFLGSLLPCDPCQQLKPEADAANSRVNRYLRRRFDEFFPDGRVVWVEYERPIRAIRNWPGLFRLHPRREGYSLLSIILAQTLREELHPGNPLAAPKRGEVGVRVANLWSDDRTADAVVPGWYTMSFDVREAGPGASITLVSDGSHPEASRKTIGRPKVLRFEIPEGSQGKRLTWNLMTGYAGINYVPGRLVLSAENSAIERILFEKRRPSSLASEYGAGSYLDATSPILPGEVVESGSAAPVVLTGTVPAPSSP